MALELLLCNQEDINQQEIKMNNTITTIRCFKAGERLSKKLNLKSTTVTAAGKMKGLSLLKVEGKVKTRQGEMR